MTIPYTVKVLILITDLGGLESLDARLGLLLLQNDKGAAVFI